MSVLLESHRQTFEQGLTIDYAPSGLWICMDDRKLDPSCKFTAEDQLYNQLAGAASGIGIDAAVMLETSKPGTFINQNVPVYFMGSLITKLAGETMGARFMNHDVCAAHLGARAVGETIMNKPELVYESAVIMKEDLSFTDIEETGEAYSRIIDTGYIIDPHTALRKFEEGSEDLPPVCTAKLADTPHNSVGFVIDHRIGKAFKVPEANNQSLAAYYSSAGNLEILCKKISNTLPLPYEKMLNQYIIRLAAIRADHLKADDGSPLPVLTISR